MNAEFLAKLNALVTDWRGRQYNYPSDCAGPETVARNDGKEDAYHDAADDLADILKTIAVEPAAPDAQSDWWQGMGTAKIAQLAAEGWVEVTDVERAAVCRHRPVFNGCTSVYLKEHYGADNVRHVAGINWFRKVVT